MLDPIKKIKACALPLNFNDIDTDRIIPARFLRCVTFDGLGDNVFIDERINPDGTKTNHPMNEAKYQKAEIILTGKNFGCGSSREHAPQAIRRAGFKAVIAESFAEIFFGNSSVIGLVCATMQKKDIDELCTFVEKNPDVVLELDIEKSLLKVGGKIYSVQIKDSLKKALINGTYDPLAELLQNKNKITRRSKLLPPQNY